MHRVKAIVILVIGRFCTAVSILIMYENHIYTRFKDHPLEGVSITGMGSGSLSYHKLLRETGNCSCSDPCLASRFFQCA